MRAYAPGMSVSLVARQNEITPNQVSTWRWLYAEGRLSAVGPARRWCRLPNYRALQHQVHGLQRCNGCSARRPSRMKSCARRWIWRSQKNGCCGRPRAGRRYAVKTIAETVGVSRSNLIDIKFEFK